MFSLIHIYKYKQTEKSLEIYDFIKIFKDFLIDEKIFNKKADINYFFTHGGCYLFAKILKKEFPEVELILNKKKTHCKVRFFDKDYDIYGFKKKDSRNFKKCNKKDILYMENCFGFMKYELYNNTTRTNENISKEDFENIFQEDTYNLFHKNQNYHRLRNLRVLN